LLLLGLAGLVLLWVGWRRLGHWCVGTSIVLFLMIGFLPVGNLLGHVLENRFPPWNPSRGAPDGIVVLGGVLDPAITRARHSPAIGGAATRLTALARLARDYPKARILFTSGDGSLLANQPAEADYVLPVLASMGVPRDRIMLENKARNTYENAVYAKAMADPKPGERWLLVTSAQHMPRAVGIFRRIGFAVEPYPVDWHTFPRFRFGLSDTFSGGLARTDDAVHEWEGLIAYRLTGRTDALLPGP
jgi:uncharacterized SAM-binding protein YcdF (DUF218 family)